MPAPSSVCLLRDTWAKRDLLSAWEKVFIADVFRSVMLRPLSPKQLVIAQKIGRMVGVGYDDPALEEAPTTKSPQPWGPLPLKPPGRR